MSVLARDVDAYNRALAAYQRKADWTQTFDKKAPDPTKAEIRQASRPSLAQQEAGLVGEVIRAGGLKTGSQGLISGQRAVES